jgi:hypothetical protein
MWPPIRDASPLPSGADAATHHIPNQAQGPLAEDCEMPKRVEVTTNEARQATTRPRTMIWVLFGSLFLCVMAGLGLAMGWIKLPIMSQ